MKQELTRREQGAGTIVSLDIGTTKVCALVAQPQPDTGELHILGVGTAPSEGLNRGVVVNIEKTIASIAQAVEQAEQRSGIRIRRVTVGIAGDHIRAQQTHSVIAISNPNREITAHDVARLLEDARSVALPPDRVILHLVPQGYIVDGQDGITDPVGMSGVRMEARVCIITALVTAVQNLHRCIERVGLQIEHVVLQPLASSYAVLESEEREVGVALVDIGGGTTDIAIFEEGVVRYTAVFGIAGRQITDDIRRGLGIIAAQAEEIKQRYGHALQESILHDEVFMIPGIGGRKPMEISKSLLCQIIQPRVEEILEFVLAEIHRAGYLNRLPAGVVLTGGTALLRGIDELAQRIFRMPVKIGFPSARGGLAPEVAHPMYSTAVGLLLFTIENQRRVKPQKRSLLQRLRAFFEEL
ncbi:MAG: cell division protein FtsA [Candidatus Kapabacteria bacterium]|nr:cell division protein FtsA [Candidatus Kapabacteria bacterium]MDW8225841.1 cell division protein FtsA [Bacteroidota bacterium]